MYTSGLIGRINIRALSCVRSAPRSIFLNPSHYRSWSAIHLAPAPRLPSRRWNASKAAAVSSDPPKITPKYQITFTCKACDHRSSHEMTKQAYSKGTVLIQCPSCKNRHLIADNLKIFSDVNVNIEDILRQQGQTIEKGALRDGDVEILPNEDQNIRLR